MTLPIWVLTAQNISVAKNATAAELAIHAKDAVFIALRDEAILFQGTFQKKGPLSI